MLSLKRIVLTILLLAGILHAEDRALLIGIGRYKNPKITLPGIQHDISGMQSVVAKLGFKPNQVKTLQDEKATFFAVVDAIRQWIINHVGPYDRVFIYFSGHGSSIPDRAPIDESDGRDEVLLAYDAGWVNGKLANVLVDDFVGELLLEIKSRNVVVIFDSCHSGTATKGIDLVGTASALDIVPKVVFFEEWASLKGFGGPPRPPKGENFVPKAPGGTGQFNYVGLMAARDDEIATASPEGSILTTALRRIFDSGGAFPTANSLHQEAINACDRYADELKKRNRIVSQHPQLIGDRARFDSPLFPETRRASTPARRP